MMRHLMAVTKNVAGQYATSRYALCGTYPSDSFAKTLDPAETTCKRCLKSRAWAAAVIGNAPALADGKTVRNIHYTVDED